MEAYQQRVIDEQADLDEKIRRLCDFIDCPKFGEVEKVQQSLLAAQVAVMRVYSAILEERIQAFK